MKKPSIFSKDYERLMRKRRKKIILSILFISSLVLTGCFITYKFLFDDYMESKEVYNQKTSYKNEEVKKQDNNSDVNNTENEEVNSIVNVNIDVNGKAVTLKETNERIVSLESDMLNFNYSISESGKEVLLTDENQNLILIDYNGDLNDITLKKYVSPKGEVFEKDVVLQTYEGYLWHTNARLLNENKVIYITNIPYFGHNLNKYISIINLETKEHHTLWQSKANEISIGEMKPNGLEVIIDDNIKNVDKDGNIN